MGWNDSGFSRRRADSAASSGFSSRPVEGREVVGGKVSGALAEAIRAYAKDRDMAVTALLDAMAIGSSTWQRMRGHESITQATVLKVVKYLGTDVRSVLTNSQRNGK